MESPALSHPIAKYRLELPAELGSLAELARFVEEKGLALGMAHEARRALELASDEAVTNVINYAYRGLPPGSINIRLERQGDTVEMTIEDRGVEFDPALAHEPDLDSPLERRPIGGLGLYFIHEMTDAVIRERIDGVNRLKLIKRLTPADPAKERS